MRYTIPKNGNSNNDRNSVVGLPGIKEAEIEKEDTNLCLNE